MRGVIEEGTEETEEQKKLGGFPSFLLFPPINLNSSDG
jgi:hypothetical protein